MAQIKPNFLIAGAGKAGTTSLHDYLAQHPDVFMSTFKEPNFFVRGYGYDNWDDYLALFSGVNGEKAVGESSTGYLCAEESPAWIKSTLGAVKIILMLRNPARRAMSLYWWMVREGYEDAPSFADALTVESIRRKDPQFRFRCLEFFGDYLYFASGLYFEQVQRFLKTFGRDNVRIYIFEEFVKDPRVTCRDIFDFLNVDPNFEPKIAIHNEGRIPASPRLQFWLRNRAPDYLPFLPSTFRRKFLNRLMTLNTRLGSVPQRDADSEKKLLERYQDDIRLLEQILERDLSVWFRENGRPEPSSDSHYVSAQ